MDLNHLRTMIVVAEFTNFVRAGEHLHLSPPAVFSQIRKLEDEIGEKLYQRSGRSLTLTVAGRILLERAKRILSEHDRALAAVSEAKEVGKGSIRFGCGPDTSVCIAPHLLSAVLAMYPNVKITIITGERERLAHEVREGQIDIVLDLPIENDTDFEIIPLWQCENVIVVSAQDILARRRIIAPGEINRRRFILPCDGRAEKAANRHFASIVGFEPTVVMNHNYAGGIKELVKLGLGVSLLPYWSVAEEIRAGRLRALRLKGIDMNEKTCLIYRRSIYVSGALSAMITIAQGWRKWLPLAKDLQEIAKQ